MGAMTHSALARRSYQETVDGSPDGNLQSVREKTYLGTRPISCVALSPPMKSLLVSTRKYFTAPHCGGYQPSMRIGRSRAGDARTTGATCPRLTSLGL